VLLYVDFTAPVAVIRARFMEIVQSSQLWEGQVAKLQVTDSKESSIGRAGTPEARPGARQGAPPSTREGTQENGEGRARTAAP
jgi:hypothetical protein